MIQLDIYYVLFSLLPSSRYFGTVEKISYSRVKKCVIVVLIPHFNKVKDKIVVFVVCV